jgi:hypothetical protein
MLPRRACFIANHGGLFEGVAAVERFDGDVSVLNVTSSVTEANFF